VCSSDLDIDENGLFELSFAITADFSAGVYAFTMPFAGELIDVIVEARATSGSGTVGVRNGATNLATNLIIMAADTVVTRLGNKILAYKDFAEGALVYLKTAGANDRGLVTCVFRKS
jgi:hypothetical protein